MAGAQTGSYEGSATPLLAAGLWPRVPRETDLSTDITAFSNREAAAPDPLDADAQVAAAAQDED
jgi:hypothetical protein